MKVRTFKEVYDDLIDIDFDTNNEGVVTGEEYEEWVKERFRNLTGEEEQAYVKCLDNISQDTEIVLFEGESHMKDELLKLKKYLERRISIKESEVDNLNKKNLSDAGHWSKGYWEGNIAAMDFVIGKIDEILDKELKEEYNSGLFNLDDKKSESGLFD